jgi:hypothetical protein
MTLETLDNMCEAHCGQRMPDAMRHKMDLSVAEGTHLQDFGSYGLYHAFKTLAKSHGNKKEAGLN